MKRDTIVKSGVQQKTFHSIFVIFENFSHVNRTKTNLFIERRRILFFFSTAVHIKKHLPKTFLVVFSIYIVSLFVFIKKNYFCIRKLVHLAQVFFSKRFFVAHMHPRGKHFFCLYSRILLFENMHVLYITSIYNNRIESAEKLFTWKEFFH